MAAEPTEFDYSISIDVTDIEEHLGNLKELIAFLYGIQLLSFTSKQADPPFDYEVPIYAVEELVRLIDGELYLRDIRYHEAKTSYDA